MSKREKEKINLENLLKKLGYKNTPAKLAILEIFSKNRIPLDAEIVYRKLKKDQNINEATVYRALSAFEKSGILRRIDLRKDSLYFELGEKHHHHMVCINCNKIEDFKNPEIEKVLGRIVEKSLKFKSIKEHSLELFGLCRACA